MDLILTQLKLGKNFKIINLGGNSIIPQGLEELPGLVNSINSMI